MLQVKIKLFGSPRFQIANQDIDFGTRKAVALIAYLAVTGQPQSRETLMTMLWPEHGHKSASQALRQTLYIARKCLGKSILPSVGKQIELDIHRNIWVDMKEFQASADAGLGSDLPQHEATELLENAVALYQGDLLTGFTLKDSAEFDDWQSFETRSLRQKYGRVLETLVQYYNEHGLYDQVLDYALRLVHCDQLDEAAHRHVMLAYKQMGQRAAALGHYDEWAQILDRQLHIEPSAETRQLREMIASEAPIAEQALAHRLDTTALGIGIPKHNLPSLATPFVGREAELAELAKLVDDPNCRLITILAPGGMGKTRLALELANQIIGPISSFSPQTQFPNGVWFVELAQIQSLEDTITTIADTVGFRLQGKRRSPKDQLLDYFRAKRTLLILDNLEHLLGEAGFAADIVQSAPNVQIVATSRERLNLYGETAFTLGGLEVPDGEKHEDALQYNAVKIFFNSARRVQPKYELQTAELEYVTNICRLCYGVPLAIELAASWVEMLSLPEIAAEITRNLDFLETTLRNVPERHHSVRATFDYSWNLLNQEQRAVFAKLAVFRGTFSRKAFQTVTGAGLRQLAMLVDKSLLQRDTDTGRYRVHELLRQYAEEELEARGELQTLRDIHSRYYLQAVHDLEEDLDGKDQLGALKSIETDIANAQAAVLHAVERGFYQELASALYNLWRYYLDRGQFLLGEILFGQLAENLRNLPSGSEHDQVLGEALAYQSFYHSEHRDSRKADTALQESEMLLKDVADSRLQVVLAYCQARCFIPSGRAREARPLLEKAISLCRQLDNRYLEAHGLHRLSNSYWIQIHGRDMAMATKYMQEAYGIRREINDTLGIAWSLSLLGSYAMTQGRYDEGERLMQKGLLLYKQIGHPEAASHNLGVFAMRRGQWDKARQYMKESLAIAHETGDLNMVSWRLWILGNIEFYTGDFAHAKALYTEGEQVGKEIANNMWLGNCWNGLGNVAMAEGDYISAGHRFHRVLETWRSENNKSLMAISYRYLGQVARFRGDYKQAHKRFDQSLAIFRELADEGGRINTQRERASLYLDEGKFADARSTAQGILGVLSGAKSTEEYLTLIDRRITLIVCHTLLGAIVSLESEIDKARHHYQEVLQIGGQHYPVPYMVTFVGKSADYFRDRGNYRRAVEIATFVTQYKGTFAYDRHHASALLVELRSRLDANDYKTAVERGKALDLEAVLEAFSTEFGDGWRESQ